MKNMAIVGVLLAALTLVSFVALGLEDSHKNMSAEAMVKQMSDMNMDAGKMLEMSGDKFDVNFIDLMISHHEGALIMCEKALANAKHAELKKMAQDMIDAQKKEILQMKEWRKAWS